MSGEELNYSTELIVCEWDRVELFSAIRVVIHVKRGIYGIPRLNRRLPWPYYYCYMNKFCRDDLLKVGSTQR